jgi:hypothetical protein
VAWQLIAAWNELFDRHAEPVAMDWAQQGPRTREAAHRKVLLDRLACDKPGPPGPCFHHDTITAR